MAESADAWVDRRRLKRRLSIWRALAVIAAAAAITVGVGRFDVIEGRPFVARLTIDGVILDDADRGRALADFADDPDAAALIVSIDSPGGSVVGGEALFRQLRDVAARKPVVATMGQVAASAGYMVAIATDHIVAREGTITGSIGVIMQTTDVTGLLRTLGVATEAIKSAPLKAVPSPLEPLTDSAREATRAVVLDMFEMFVDMVAERRGMPRDAVLKVADGRVYTGRQAKGLGLIDAIGGEEAARAWLAGKGVDRDLPVRPLRIRREDEFWREMLTSLARAIAGKMFSSERLTLDGLVSVWHPDVNLR